MGVAGIVSEYNPFHLGHAYQLRETRRVLGGETALVCAMSGSFVQRGECAVMDKWRRAKCALLGGADLVLELPTLWACASAETFARGAVGLLAATGVVDTLSFGSEAGTLEDLQAAAHCLDTAEYEVNLREELACGVSFATARERAVRSLIGAAAACLATPNNNLAVEYLRALPPHMCAMTVQRVGAAHDGVEAGGYASASALRGRLLAGDWAGAAGYLTAHSAEELQGAMAAGVAPASLEHCQRAMLARLRTMTRADFAALPDSGAAEGLPARLVRVAGESCSVEGFLDGVKTKRYAHARLRRLALWAFLGLTAADRPPSVPYIRVLGMNGRGKELLGQMKQKSTLPILTKSAHAKRLPDVARALFEQEARCTDLYALCTPRIQSSGMEWTQNPVVV